MLPMNSAIRLFSCFSFLTSTSRSYLIMPGILESFASIFPFSLPSYMSKQEHQCLESQSPGKLNTTIDSLATIQQDSYTVTHFSSIPSPNLMHFQAYLENIISAQWPLAKHPGEYSFALDYNEFTLPMKIPGFLGQFISCLILFHRGEGRGQGVT